MCCHYPHPMLQILNVSVEFYKNSLKAMRPDDTMEVYGLIAVRDPSDFSRNYIFRRSRENAQAVDVVINNPKLFSAS